MIRDNKYKKIERENIYVACDGRGFRSLFVQKLLWKTYGPAHGILVLIAFAQMPLLNVHADISGGLEV